MLSGFVGVPSIDGVYWTLFVEMRFYALIALLLLIRRINQIELFLGVWLALSIILEFFEVKLLSFALITHYSALFIAGSLFYINWKNGASILRYVGIATCFLLTVFQELQKLSYFKEKYGSSISEFSVVMILSVIFGIMFLVSTNRTGFLRKMNWLTAGALTYPLYLLHQYIGYIIFNTFGELVNKHVLLVGSIIFMMTVAYLVHRFVENPLSSFMKNWIDRALGKLGSGVQQASASRLAD
jgi:peptidoglycan/LPS O-acetylase OafA/YrhL